jgi:predicted transcriptional regulator
MPISIDEFRRLPNLEGIRESKLAWQVYEAISKRPSSVAEIAQVLNRRVEKVVSILNQLMRRGFVGFSLASNREVRFYWVQTLEGEPALREK